ncbi:YegJ family protein [Rhizobium pisi]|uniref:YegJ family protein n=1 Tax=Rhizobium pisi TaxID=574561 RepID=UPI0039B0E3D3
MLRSVISLFSMLGLSILVIPTELALATDNPNVQSIVPGDPAMAKAHEKSEQGLDGFLEKLRNPPPGTENYSIKLGFTDKGKDIRLTTDQMAPNVEFMWVYQIKASGDHFTALLGDTPEYIHNIKPDDRVEFEKSDIFDWLYIENGKVKGNYTACPLLLAGPKEQLDQYREIYGIVCD